MEIIYDSPVPVYRQVANWLRERIERGEFAPDTRIPTEKDIVGELGVARETARKAVAYLREQGIVYTVPAMGTFVKRPE